MTNTESRLQSVLALGYSVGAKSATGDVDDTSDVDYFELLTAWGIRKEN